MESWEEEKESDMDSLQRRRRYQKGKEEEEAAFGRRLVGKRWDFGEEWGKIGEKMEGQQREARREGSWRWNLPLSGGTVYRAFREYRS